MQHHKFSILVPAFKAKFLKECIDSVLVQTFSDFELVIVNDASPEDLDSIIMNYNDPRIRYYVNEKNCGAVDVVDNWNKCLGYATGDYVICMGDDDKLLPNCLEEYNKLIDKYPGIGLLHGWTELIDEKSVPFAMTTLRGDYESAMSLCWHRWMGAYRLQFIGDFCFERDWILKQGGFFKLPLAWSSDDISALIAASKNGVANTQSVVFQYRRSRYTISSTGNVYTKLKAILDEKKWYESFLRTEITDHYDILYRQELLSKFNLHFDKKVGMTIYHTLRKNRLKIFSWLFQKKKFGISNKSLAFALVQSFKGND